MDWVYVNPFTGYVYFNGLKMYETQNDSIFLSVNGLRANFSMYKMLSGSFEIEEIELDQPKGIILQHNRDLNFDDLIQRFTSKKPGTKPPVHFSILNFKINNGEFYFEENKMPISYFIKNVNCECSGFKWDADTTAGSLSFRAGKDGSQVKMDFSINYKTMAYRFGAIASKFNLEIINQYLKQLVNYGTFRADVDLDVEVAGNFNDKTDIKANGLVSVNNLHFGKDRLEDYMSFEKLVVGIKELDPKHRMFQIDSLLLDHSYFKYERYEHLDNLQAMFGKNGANITAAKGDPEKFNLVIEILRYVKIISKNFLKSSYKINRLALTDADLRYNDYLLGEKFSLNTCPLEIRADSIDKNRDRVKLFLKSALKPYGNLSVDLSINPNDSSDFDMNYYFEKIPASSLNPYLISYTSFPMDRGTIEMKGRWNVQNGLIKSTNHLLIIDPRIGKRVQRTDVKHIPMHLLMGFIRERGNVIDYEIPITGNLKDPKFNLHDVISDLIRNIFIKPPTTMYGIHVKEAEGEIEKSLTLKWELGDYSLADKQKRFIRGMAGFLKDSPAASLSVEPLCYTEKEKEQLLFFEAKKKYFLLNHQQSVLSAKDLLSIEQMSIKDSLFVRYLNKQVGAVMMYTIQQKCSALVGTYKINSRLNQLMKDRQELFSSYFIANGTYDRVHIKPGGTGIPYNGFSYYRINYIGDIPTALASAYETLKEMNEGKRRKTYLKIRKKGYLISGQ